MQSEKLYEVVGELVTVGKKHITVRCPRTMKAMIDANLQWFPVAEYFRRIRDDEDAHNVVTLFNIRVLDKFYKPKAGEANRTYDIRLVVPESLTSEVTCDPELKLGKLSGQSESAAQFIGDVSDLLACWFPTMSLKRDDTTAPVTFRHLDSASANLKWPWKIPIADFFDGFNRELKMHMIDFGVGYYNQKNSEIGISLRLSQFPGLTQRGAYLSKVEQSERNSKKRKIITLDSEGNELSTESSTESPTDIKCDLV